MTVLFVPFDLWIVTSLISLNNHLGPCFVFSAVSVLTTQLSMSSLNIYHQFMSFRDSLPLVRFLRPRNLNIDICLEISAVPP